MGSFFFSDLATVQWFWFFFPPFLFRSFHEEETLLERRAIPCSTTSPFQIAKNSAGNSFQHGDREIFQKFKDTLLRLFQSPIIALEWHWRFQRKAVIHHQQVSYAQLCKYISEESSVRLFLNLQHCKNRTRNTVCLAFIFVLIHFHSEFQNVFLSLMCTLPKTETFQCNLSQKQPRENSVPMSKEEVLTDISTLKKARDNKLVHQNQFLNFTTFSSSPVVSLGFLNPISWYY